MKGMIFCISMLLLALFFPFPGFLDAAEDDTSSFVIAPPPVGYPVFTPGTVSSWGGNFIYTSIENMGLSMKTLGGLMMGNYQQTFNPRFTLSFSLGMGLLAGNQYQFLSVPVPVQMNALLAVINRSRLSLFLFGGAGGNINFSRMVIDIPQVVNITLVTDPVTVSTNAFSGAVNGGAQLNFTVKDFIFSPFYTYYYTAGTYTTTMTSSMSFPYDDQTGDIPGYSNSIYGFDVLYKPLDLSLSSFFQVNERYKLVSIAVRKLLPQTGGLLNRLSPR